MPSEDWIEGQAARTPEEQAAWEADMGRRLAGETNPGPASGAKAGYAAALDNLRAFRDSCLADAEWHAEKGLLGAAGTSYIRAGAITDAISFLEATEGEGNE